MKINDYKSALPDIILLREVKKSVRDITFADYLNTLFLINGLYKKREFLKPDLSMSALKKYANKKDGSISVKDCRSTLVVENNNDLVKALSYEMLISVAQLITSVGANQKTAITILGEPAKTLNLLKKDNVMSIESINKMMDGLGEGLVFTGFNENQVSFTREIGEILINVLKELSNKNLINSAINNHFAMCDFLIDKSLVDSPKTSNIFSKFELSKEQESILVVKIIEKKFNDLIKEQLSEKKYNDYLMTRQAGVIYSLCSFLDVNSTKVEDALIERIDIYYNTFKKAFPDLEPVYLQKMLHNISDNHGEFKSKIKFLKNNDNEFKFVDKVEHVLNFKISCANYSKYQCFINKAFIMSEIEKIEEALQKNVKMFNQANFEMIERVDLKIYKNDLNLSFVRNENTEKYFEPFSNLLLDMLLKKDWRETFNPNELQLLESKFIAEEMKGEMKLDIKDDSTLKNKRSVFKF